MGRLATHLAGLKGWCVLGWICEGQVKPPLTQIARATVSWPRMEKRLWSWLRFSNTYALDERKPSLITQGFFVTRGTSFLFCCCDRTSWQKQLRGDRACFHSQFQVTVYLVGSQGRVDLKQQDTSQNQQIHTCMLALTWISPFLHSSGSSVQSMLSLMIHWSSH